VDNACAALSPAYLSPHSQCNTDNQCPSLSPDILAPPTSPYCCNDIRDFVAYYCRGANATAVPCVERPNACVAQPLPFRVPTTPGFTTAPAAAPTPTPTPTPTPGPANLQVKLSLNLAAFNASVQQTFKEQMSVAAGLPKSDAAARVAITFRAARRRLLDGGSVAVDVTITMPDAASASKAVSSLTASNINAQLAAAGLPPATITSAAAQGGAPLMNGAAGLTRTRIPPGLMPAAIGGWLAAVAVARAAW
jgi:hypothetical protein